MKKFAYLLAILFFTGSLRAQESGTGTYPFSSFDNKGFDAINLGNLDAHFAIPIVARQGRGISFNYSLVYDSLIWSPLKSNSTTTWQPDITFGLHGQVVGLITGYLTYSSSSQVCGRGTGTFQSNFVYHDPYGQVHGFPYFPPFCGGKGSGTVAATDGSGYSTNGSVIYTRYGQTLTVPINPAPGSIGSGSFTDAKGNKITNNGNGNFTDTLGVTALTVGGGASASSPMTLTYPVTLQSDSATTATATVFYKTYTVRTNFQCSGIVEFGTQLASLADHITLADGTLYSFTYEPTPSATDGAVTARLASITLPTGGLISYAYTGGCNGTGINADGTTSSLTRTTSDGKKTYVRAVVNANATSTTTTDEKTNVSTYQFTEDSSSSQFYETHRQIYQGSATGTPLFQQTTCYNGAAVPCDGASMALPISSTNVISSNNGGSSITTNNAYNSSGLLTSSMILSGSTTLTSTALAYNGFGEVTSSAISDGSGNVVSSTTYGYDETTPTVTSGIPQHTAPGTVEGNPTSVKVSIGGGATLNTTTTYYDTGQPITATSPDGGKTTYSYDATQTFATTTALPTPSSGVALSTSASFDTQSTMPLSMTGANPGQTSTITAFDRLLRTVSITLPNSGTQSFTYSTSQYGMQYGVKQSLNSSVSSDTETLYDAYGRVSRVAVANGQSANPWYQTDYCYDASGLLQFQSVSYSGIGWQTPKQCSGAGVTYVYDALGRAVSTQTPDGTATSRYANRAILTKDVNGVQNITQYDLLGRITSVCELSGSTLNGVGPVACGQDIAANGFLTSYVYDLTNHKVTTTQGSQQRTFTTDAAGRPTGVVEPERGTTGYTYNYNSIGLLVSRTRPKANQTNAATLTTTSTQYDTLGRIVDIKYDDTITPEKSYFYDTAVVAQQWSTTPTNVKGLLAAAVSGSGSSLTRAQFSYDIMGNLTSMPQCAPSICGTSSQESRPAPSFSYDWAGNMISESEAVSGSIAYGRSPAGEITSIVNQQYTDAINTPNLVTNVVNGPHGPISYALGNGLSVYKSYDTSGRLSAQWLCSGSAQANCPTQLYGTDAYRSGSRVTFMDDTLLGASRSFGYDEFNRLTSAVRSNNTTQSNFTYSYDRYGNRLSQTVTQGSGPQPSLSFDPTTNRINSYGYAYDAAGNLTSDGVHHYSYDGEGNLLAVDSGSTATYVYDAMNHRVREQTANTTFEYLFEIYDKPIARFNVTSNNWGDEGRIYWDGRPLAFRRIYGDTLFEHQDILGTERMRTNYQGTLQESDSSLPFGDGYSANVTGTAADQDNRHFAMLAWDAESYTDHAQFRQYSPTQAQWMSPDPYDGSYDAGNPQSFNRYAYVLNNPLSIDDPTGLHWECSSGGIVGDTSSGSCVWVDDNNPVTTPPWYISEYGGGNCGSSANVSYQCSGTPGSTGTAAAQKAPSKNDITKQCVQQYQNSLSGKAVNQLSLGAYVPGWGPDPKGSFRELGLVLGLKFGGGKLAAAGLNKFNTQTLTSLFNETTIASAAGTGLSELIHGAGIASGIGTIYATGLDLLAHAGCATVAMQATGQMTPVGPAYIP